MGCVLGRLLQVWGLNWQPCPRHPAPQSIKKKLEAMDAEASVRVVIVSYEMVKKMAEELAEYSTIVVDESHHLKAGAWGVAGGWIFKPQGLLGAC